MRFRGPFDKQNGKWDQRVLKSEWHHFYHFYWSLWGQLISKNSLLVIRKFSGLFFNTLTVGQKVIRKFSGLFFNTLTVGQKVIRKFSGLFFNTLTVGQKDSLLNRNNLTSPTLMQLSLNVKAFSQIFSAYLKCR